jgi:hypothetical protein
MSGIAIHDHEGACANPNAEFLWGGP